MDHVGARSCRLGLHRRSDVVEPRATQKTSPVANGIAATNPHLVRRWCKDAVQAAVEMQWRRFEFNAALPEPKRAHRNVS